MAESLVKSAQYEPTLVNDVFTLSIESVKESLFIFTSRSNIYEYELGCLLFRVKEQNLWRKPEFCRTSRIYPNFSSWIYGELGFSSRKGRSLLFIVRRLMEIKADSELIKMFMMIGWAKAYQVLRVATSKEEADKWLQKAAQKSEREIIVDVQAEIDHSNAEPFLKKEEKETRHVAVKFKNKEDYSFFSTAIGVTEKKCGTSDLGEIIAIWAANYLATKPAGDGDAELVPLPNVLEAVEKTYGIKLGIIDEQYAEHDKRCSSYVAEQS